MFIKEYQLKDDIICEFAHEDLQVKQKGINEGNNENQNRLEEIDMSDSVVFS